MSPEQKQINELKAQVATLEQFARQFLSQAELDPQIQRTISILNSSISKVSSGGTSGVHQSVSESGTSTYNVAAAYAGTLVAVDPDGNEYKLGYYTP